MVYVTAFTTVEDDVFVGPCAMTTNDDTMSRHGPEYALRGATLRRACRIGGGAVLTARASRSARRRSSRPGALVTRDVPPRGVVIGVPARGSRRPRRRAARALAVGAGAATRRRGRGGGAADGSATSRHAGSGPR